MYFEHHTLLSVDYEKCPLRPEFSFIFINKLVQNVRLLYHPLSWLRYESCSESIGVLHTVS